MTVKQLQRLVVQTDSVYSDQVKYWAVLLLIVSVYQFSVESHWFHHCLSYFFRYSLLIVYYEY